jgi:D-alanyl-D-alanine carboxypeptidase
VNRRSLPVWGALLALLWAVSAAAQPAALQQAPSKPWAAAIDEIDAMVAEELAKDGVGSVTIGIVTGPRLAWTKSYGQADSEAKRAASRESVYRIGSITKQFTALMLLQLVEQGKVHLTDPLQKYVPEFAQVAPLFPGMPQPTLIQLATMTSGLAREPVGAPDHSVGPVSGWQDKVLTAIPFVKYAHEPDTRYLYSNIGYATLGVALSRAAGQPFTDYVQQRILKPLGMTRTVFDPDAAMRPHLAKGYEILEGGKVDGEASVREYAGRGYRVPNGALFSTVDDLARFVSWELGEGPSGILKKETQDDNYRRVSSANGDLTSGYGVGFMATRRGTLVALGHGGTTAGFRAAAQFDRRSKNGVIV